MNITSIRNVVTSKLGLKVLAGKRHAPTILFVAGAVGVVGAVVLACRATLKLEKVVEEAQVGMEEAKNLRDQGEITEVEFNKEVTKHYFRAGVRIGKLFAPAVVVGAASIAALTGSHVMLNNRYISATAAYAALDRGYKEYRKRVVEKFGAQQDLEFKHGVQEVEIVEEGPNGPEIKTIRRAALHNTSPYSYWFNEHSVNFEPDSFANRLFLQAQQNHWNYILQRDGYVTLNQVLEKLGLPRSKAGQIVGWTKDAHESKKGDGFVDFGIFDGSEGSVDFMNGWNKTVLLDFNVDGIILNDIERFENR